MRKIAWLVVIALVAVAPAASAILRIADFHAEIGIGEDGQVTIEETIAVNYLTAHHGIERWMPVSYSRWTGEKLNVPVHVLSVTMEGQPVPYVTRRSGADLVLRIGDPDRTVTGAHQYMIRYRVLRALLFDATTVRLYWNVTGFWEVPLDHASAAISLPAGVDPAAVQATSYLGHYGSISKGAAASMDAAGRVILEAGSFSPGEGLTVDLAFPREGSGIVPPTIGQRIGWFVAANWYAILPLLTVAGMTLLWWKKGRDPALGTIAPRFEPPSGVDAGEAGILIDDRADLRDVSALVVGLAVKGYLKIREVEEVDAGLASKLKDAFGGRSQDFEFVKVKAADDRLSLAESTILEAFFDKEHPEKRTLSSLENHFYQSLPAVKSALYSSLIKGKYYSSNPERTRGAYVSLGMVVLILGGAVGVWAGSLYLAIALGLCGLVIFPFARIMPRKTQKGAEALRDLRGLAEYIGRAEVKQMEFHDAPEKSPQLFEKLLPYAIALNLTSIWTGKFEGLFREPPEWYAGRGPTFNAGLFGLSMMHLSSGMERSFVSAPRTSSAGGRSAWSGGGHFGGGFSGGGFGGGGGRGW